MYKRPCFLLVLTVCLQVCSVLSSAADQLSLAGKVSDGNGNPVEHATVLVYSVGVKKGYSLYCPTCYIDWGKHAVTDATGTFMLCGSGDSTAANSNGGATCP